MAAAASAEPVSPELALVDATLAERLRANDAPALYVVPTPPTATEPEEAVVEAVEYQVAAPSSPVDEYDPIADLIVQDSDLDPRLTEPSILDAAPDLAPSADLIVEEVVEEETAQHAETSWYPALPAPVEEPEATDATDALLREIRDRLATPAPVKRRRRFRKRFTVASGLSTAVALGVFGASVGFGVMQLPV